LKPFNASSPRKRHTLYVCYDNKVKWFNFKNAVHFTQPFFCHNPGFQTFDTGSAACGCRNDTYAD